MSSLSALMLTINFGMSLCCVSLIQMSHQSSFLQPVRQIFCIFTLFFLFVHVFSEDVLPSIHTDPEYPCELVGTWNTWYGEQDQAGKNIHHTRVIPDFVFKCQRGELFEAIQSGYSSKLNLLFRRGNIRLKSHKHITRR